MIDEFIEKEPTALIKEAGFPAGKGDTCIVTGAVVIVFDTSCIVFIIPNGLRTGRNTCMLTSYFP